MSNCKLNDTAFPETEKQKDKEVYDMRHMLKIIGLGLLFGTLGVLLAKVLFVIVTVILKITFKFVAGIFRIIFRFITG